MDYEFENEGFVIDNDNKANWALKKIKEATAEADRLKAIITAERDELTEKEDRINEKLERDTGYLKALLYNYFETVEHKATKTQESYKLLDGSLVYKIPTRKIAKPDEGRLIAYLKTNAPELVKTVETAAWGDFKKALAVADDGTVINVETGEVLDFIGTEETAGTFDVKVG